MLPTLVWGHQDISNQLISNHLRQLPHSFNENLQMPLQQNFVYLPQAIGHHHMSPNQYVSPIPQLPIHLDKNIVGSNPGQNQPPRLALNGLNAAMAGQVLMNNNNTSFINNNGPLLVNNPMYSNGVLFSGVGAQITKSVAAVSEEKGRSSVGKKRPYEIMNSNSTVNQSAITATVEAKKSKLSSFGDASRYLSIIGIPNDVTENDIKHLTQSFGAALSVIINNNQAVVEMENSSSATNAVTFYSDKVTFLRGRTVQLKPGIAESTIHESFHTTPKKEHQIDLLETGEEVSCVLNVSVRDLMYPVVPDLVAQIFNQCGETKQIVLVKNTKNEVVYLVEYTQLSFSETAQKKYDEQYMYAGCNKLSVKYSKIKDLKQININNNNISATTVMSTTSTATDSQAKQLQELQQLQNFQNAQLQQLQQFQQLQNMQHVQLPGQPSLAIMQPTPQQLFAQQLAQQQILQQHQLLQQNQLINPTIIGGSGHTKLEYPGTIMALNHPQIQFAQFLQAPNPALQIAGGQILAGPNAGTILIAPQIPNGNVLLVSNINEKKVTPDALFILFGVYGDVVRVKIMFNKQDTALIQFVDAMQAQTAMLNLDKLKLWGNVIKVAPSKHTIVQMPKDGQPDAGLTKDFTNSSLHRFKKPNSKNFQNIFPPSSTLHLSNMPAISKEKLVELFSEHGTVAGFKFFFKDCKMALVQMNSIEEAANALIHMHNYQLAETTHLRVSFSKSSVTANSTDGNEAEI